MRGKHGKELIKKEGKRGLSSFPPFSPRRGEKGGKPGFPPSFPPKGDMERSDENGGNTRRGPLSSVFPPTGGKEKGRRE